MRACGFWGKGGGRVGPPFLQVSGRQGEGGRWLASLLTPPCGV
ncbi:hypothetical protein HMPREF0262_01431 [Clostridium sp. ATCC 29733]|nr:hypothetical protein HMPREF0262_01431 [Clostridium sp. ATCC 29733]